MESVVGHVVMRCCVMICFRDRHNRQDHRNAAARSDGRIRSGHERDELSPPRQLRPGRLRGRHRLQQLRPPAGPDGTRAVVDAAIDAGITLFDTADIYGTPRGSSEELLGAALKGRRDEIVLATKFGMDMDGPERRRPRRARLAVATSSGRWRPRCAGCDTDYIDLYQIHAPDPATPIEETLSALDDLVRAGKVRYLGNSNFAGWQIADADWTARTAGLDPVHQRAEPVQPAAPRRWRPRCCRPASTSAWACCRSSRWHSGLLTGKYRRGEKPPEGTRLSPGPVPALARRRRLGHHRGADRVRRASAVTACSTSRSPGSPPGPR